MADQPFDLDRFLTAQERHYAQALAELRAGSKRSHWIWFVFPQIAGLGQSETARFYAIGSLAEAKAYLAHLVLGPRLLGATEALLRHPDRSAETILGGIDAIKLRSSLTLFLEAGAGAPLDAALAMFFNGAKDPATLRLLKA
ncbi:DUF1810 domain-containing protein [uncultured Sphingomonas sp.]|uniref:DUF1810 domain-containing protein n=1 Tax=uncultured Sphingomonas sp. TaxID=158754 RepID=UPI0035CC9233